MYQSTCAMVSSARRANSRRTKRASRSRLPGIEPPGASRSQPAVVVPASARRRLRAAVRAQRTGSRPARTGSKLVPGELPPSVRGSTMDSEPKPDPLAPVHHQIGCRSIGAGGIPVKTIAHPVLHDRRARRVAIALGLAVALATWLGGCGGGGSGGSLGGGTGSAAVVVTDAPTDEFAQVLLTVTKVELLGAGGHFTLFEGRRDFDLLSLRDDARLLAVGRDVPAGDWSKIRLHVENVELIRTTLPEDLEGDEIECPEGVGPDEGFV